MITRRDLFKAAALPALAGGVKLSAAPKGAEEEDLTKFVNIFVGTGGHGHTYPGATVPFGMVQLSPDTYNSNWDHCSGYHISDSSIMGFSHTHLSGTGCGDLLDVLLMPGTGPVRLVPGALDGSGEGYRSRFSHDEEHAEPGYYSVVLQDYKIKAELSATERAGIHQYTFPESDDNHFIIDLAHAYLNNADAPPEVFSAEMKVAAKDTITGGRRVNVWGKGRYIYFAMKFSKPFSAAELYSDDQPVGNGAKEASGKLLKGVVHFKTSAGQVLRVKVGLSGVSAEGALKNLETEIPQWDFEKVRRDAHNAWARELGRIRVETADTDKKTIFYSSLYHSMLAPTLFDDVDRQYRGMDEKVHRLAQGQHNYSTYSAWDTYRALHPLYTLVSKRPRAGLSELPHSPGQRESGGYAGLAAAGRRDRLHDRLSLGRDYRGSSREAFPRYRASAGLRADHEARDERRLSRVGVLPEARIHPVRQRSGIGDQDARVFV